MAQALPSGVVTLVFTDIEGSSELSERFRDAFEPVRQEHFRILRETVARWNGFEVKSIGDSLFLGFDRASDAVQWAVDAQIALLEHTWKITPVPAGTNAGTDAPSEIETPLRVRIGMHTGEPLLPVGDSTPDYYGPPVNRAARVESAGHGGQILLSDSTRSVAGVEVPPEITFKDQGIHRLKGVGEERLWQVLHPALPLEFPPLRTLGNDSQNLPSLPTSFVGREDQIHEWHAVLQRPTTRLLTLAGFGGMGKTRSALQIAELCVGEFPDGVWWVELEEAQSQEQMIERIAFGLRLQLQPQPSGREQLLAYLSSRKLLLVMDNTEQIAEAGRVVGQLLAAAPEVKCLVTSRCALEITAEKLIEVPPLPSADAVHLFEERARSRQSGFAISAENARDVVDLCRRLEGVPLAIELAASRITGMTPREILKRLSEGFRLLRTQSPDLPARQRALRGAIDWSYNLLHEEEKSLFAQLSVFAGGFLLESAEAVCEAFDVFESVMELRRHSLLRSEMDAETQQTRYLMLESLRDYASEKLAESPEERSAARQRHAAFFLPFAQERVARMRTREELAALQELGPEMENLRAATQWTRDNKQAEACARLSLALYQVLYCRGFWAEAQQCMQEAWAVVGEEHPGAAAAENGEIGVLRVRISHSLAAVADDLGQPAEAERWAGISLDLSRRHRDPEGTAEALNLLAVLAMRRGGLDAARQQCEESLSLRSESDHAGRAKALNNLAMIARRRGEREEAIRLYGQCLTERSASGDARGEALTLGNLGLMARETGDLVEAKRLYRQSLVIRRHLQDRHGIAVMLNNLGEIAMDEDQPEAAIPLFVHAREIFHDLRSVYAEESARCLKVLGEKLGAARLEELTRASSAIRWEDAAAI